MVQNYKLSKIFFLLDSNGCNRHISKIYLISSCSCGSIFVIHDYCLKLCHNKCVEIPYPSPSNSTGELTCSGLHRLVLAVFMDTPGTYRLFLIKDIKQGELLEPQSTCFRHFHYTCLPLCSKSLQRMETPVVLPLELLYM